MKEVWVSLGANLDQADLKIKAGIKRLEKHPAIRLKAVSSLYRSAPLHYKNQDDFLNAIALIESDLKPLELLDIFQEIERLEGRIKSKIAFGPRNLDLDLLLYEDLIYKSERLTLPHPRMHERAFVLLPFCEINPLVVHPILKDSMAELLSRISLSKQKVEKISCPA